MDASKLRHGLTEYAGALDRQLKETRDQKQRLDAVWRRTQDVYRGTGAEVFADAFVRSMTMMQSYIEMLELVLPILNKRIEALDQFDSPRNPEP